MRRTVLAMALSIISVIAGADQDGDDYVGFLQRYRAFSEEQNSIRSHNAHFSGQLQFRQGCGIFDSDDCGCPHGNNYLQCLRSAKAVIDVDPRDVGSRGYVLVAVGRYALGPDGRWVPFTNKNIYSYSIDRLGSRHEFNIPIPNESLIEQFCAENGADPVFITVGYGVASDMDLEFARRVRDRAASVGQQFDADGFIYTRARADGIRQRKGADIGYAVCRYYNSDNSM